MPSSCCVPNCPVSVIRGNVDTYAFTFPKDPVRRKQWLKAIGRQEYNVSRGSVVCSRHFDESCIVRSGRAVGESAAPKSKMRLTASACPTRNIGGIDLRLPAAPSNAFIYRGVRNDASLVPPIRQTASIFKQPVTVYRTQEGKVKADFKHGPQEKPKQLFWEKRLEGMRASDANGNPLERMELPKSLRAAGPGVRDETVLQSVATALHVLTQPITGQASLKPGMEKNASVFINPEQPLIQAINISDDDIKRQEERVNLARKKLQEAMRGYDL